MRASIEVGDCGELLNMATKQAKDAIFPEVKLPEVKFPELKLTTPEMDALLKSYDLGLAKLAEQWKVEL